MEQTAHLLIPADFKGLQRNVARLGFDFSLVQQIGRIHHEPHIFDGVAGVGMLAEDIREKRVFSGDDLVNHVVFIDEVRQNVLRKPIETAQQRCAGLRMKHLCRRVQLMRDIRKNHRDAMRPIFG